MESFGVSDAQFGGPTGNSFTALLELPPGQAVELLHSSGDAAGDVRDLHHQLPYSHTLNCSLPFPSNAALIQRAAKYSVFAGGEDRALDMKIEPAECNSSPNLSEKTAKRKIGEEKGKGSVKKRKPSGEDEKIQYVHVRARRGEATDSHSLAERARREKINARMKLLQELVPGCTKISGTALVLDQIINHVQNLQRQVEYLSMKLAEANPRTDFNIHSLFSAGNRSLMGGNFQSMMMPITWPEIQMNGDGQQGQEQWPLESVTQPDWAGEENQCNLITRENSLLSYHSSGNSVLLRPSHHQTEQGNAS